MILSCKIYCFGLFEKWFNSSAPHADIQGFESPTGYNKFWMISSVGRASALQAEGRRFESVSAHGGVPCDSLLWLQGLFF